MTQPTPQPATRPTTRPQTKPPPISPGELAANRDALAALMREPPVPAAPKLTTLMAVLELAPQIRAALKAGHTLAEIAQRLRLGGRTLSAQQLQRYLGRCEKRAARKASSRKAAPPSTDAAAPRTPSRSPSAEAQGATGSTMRDVPTVQAPTVVRSTPPAAVTPVATTGGATPAGAGAGAGAATGPATAGQEHRTAAPNAAPPLASSSASTTAKPQSTASPELPGLSVEVAQRRAVDRLLATARPGANVDPPRETNMTWQFAGRPVGPSADDDKTEPPLGPRTRP